MPRLKYLTPAHTRNEERKRQVWLLRTSGATAQEIATQLGISRQHVNRLLQMELDVVRHERTDMARDYMDLNLARCEAAILTATSMTSDKCRVCKEQGYIINSDRNMEACPNCRGTKLMLGPDTRLRAMDLVLKAVGEIQDILNGPVLKVAFTDTQGNDLVRQELNSFSDDELTEQLLQILTPERRAELLAIAVGVSPDIAA